VVDTPQLIVGLNIGLTVTITVADPVQVAAVPVTVKVVVAAGVTETGEPAKGPGVQTKVVPPMLLFAVNDDEAPVQIVAGVAVGVITGFGLTVIVNVVEEAHCPPFGLNV
jgi:hypothetical protein